MGLKSLRYLLTDPSQFDILQSGLGWRGWNEIRSIEKARFHHAARLRGGCMVARGARAAARDAGHCAALVAIHRNEWSRLLECATF